MLLIQEHYVNLIGTRKNMKEHNKEIPYYVIWSCLPLITGIILGIIGDFKRIAGKNNRKLKKHNRLVPICVVSPVLIIIFKKS